MKIIFFHSILCPRCLYVNHILKKLERWYPDLEVEKVEITGNLKRFRKENIRCIPALKSGTAILSGILLSKTEIEKFLNEQLRKNHNKPTG